MYNSAYTPDIYESRYGNSYSRNRAEPYTIEQDYGAREERKTNNKNNKRAKKALRKIRKADGKDNDAVNVGGGIETAPDGGVSAWVVCGGSAVLTTANSVVKVSLHESIESLNEDFTNSTPCIDGLKANFDTIYGGLPGSQLAQDCLELGSDTGAYNCIAKYMYNYWINSTPDGFERTDPTFTACRTRGASGFFPCMYDNYRGFSSLRGYNFIDEYCSYLWSPSSRNLSLPSFARLTAGNVFSASVSTEDDEFGTLLNYIFLAVSLFCVLLGGILSVFTGYRITAILGSILVAVGFIVASFMDEDDEIVVQLLVGGVGGIGFAFLRVSAIIAVLEYFKDLRMRAIVISGLGAVLINFLLIGLTFVDSIDFDWRTTFRFQAIPAGISLIAGLVMAPLRLKRSGRDSQEEASCSTKCSDYVFSRDLFTNSVLYLVMLLFLLDQIGRPIFSEGMQPYLREKQFSKTQVDIQPFIENGGSLLGLISLLFWRRQNLADNLTVMAAMDILVGLLALHVPELSVYAWAVAYSAIFGFSDGVFVSLVQDAIPEGFSRRHIRMVAGLLGLVAGLGIVVSGFVTDVIEKNSDGKHVAYYFAGGCLIGAGILCIVSRIVVVLQQINSQRRYREQDELPKTIQRTR